MKDAGYVKARKALVLIVIISIAIDIIYAMLPELERSLFPIIATLPLIITILHSSLLLGRKRAFILLILAFVLGSIFEALGVAYGSSIGLGYEYIGDVPSILGVPIYIPLYWAVFIYGGYVISNSFLVWAGKGKPSSRQGSLPLLILLVFLDGLVVTSIDLVMEPISVIEGRWRWMTPGPYFGVPLSNFAGWFILTILTTGMFRLIEYRSPGRERKDYGLYILSLAGYFTFFVIYIVKAARHGLHDLILIDIFAILPILIINLALYTAHKADRRVQ